MWRDQCITAGLAQCIITQTPVVFCRVEECKAAYNHSQGLALFGSKIKLTPLDVDGKGYRMKSLQCTCVYVHVLLFGTCMNTVCRLCPNSLFE